MLALTHYSSRVLNREERSVSRLQAGDQSTFDWLVKAVEVLFRVFRYSIDQQVVTRLFGIG